MTRYSLIASVSNDSWEAMKSVLDASVPHISSLTRPATWHRRSNSMCRMAYGYNPSSSPCKRFNAAARITVVEDLAATFTCRQKGLMREEINVSSHTFRAREDRRKWVRSGRLR